MKTDEPQRKNMTAFETQIASNSILKEINNGCQTNLVLSPLLLHIALNMLASASTGRTLKQLLQFLESESITDLNAQSSIFAELATSGGGEGPIISLANGIWVHNSFPLKPSYKQLVEDVYKAKSQSFDFVNQGEQVRHEINSWAREASKGHIYPLLPRGFFTEDAIALLASAIYFKGTWVQKFDASDTKDGDFHLRNGQTIKVPFMRMSYTRQLYGSFESFKLLKMAYKNGESHNKKYAMYIFLPHEKDGLQELVEKFRSDPRFLLENQKVSKVLLKELQLPKMKYEYELNVKKTMEEVGLDLPFDEKKAEITEMVETHEVVYLSKVIQKSYIEVDEEGTIATAVNISLLSAGASPCSMPPPPQHSFVADHPFLFMIKEEVSGIIVFVGAALNPISEGVTGKKRKKEATKKKMKEQKHRKKKQLVPWPERITITT
ncbi:serpin-Z3-like [Euphorbia lathyris]|uniref:serpin-Z3-like n=1 Tax=Euphorbia lathyris TaxID=212925 RepID=UPI0033144C92